MLRNVLLAVAQHLLVRDLLSGKLDLLLQERLRLLLRVELHVDSSLERLVADEATHLNETNYVRSTTHCLLLP